MDQSIYLACLNNSCPDLLQKLAEKMNKTFLFPVRTLQLKLDLKSFYSQEREQYEATSILKSLESLRPNFSGKIIAMMSEDIYIPIFTYVFGLAHLNGNSAVVSYYRLQNQYYGLKPDHSLLFIRIYKEVIHEMGHLFGLRHCYKSWCVMYSANTIDDLDIKSDAFCEECEQILLAIARR